MDRIRAAWSSVTASPRSIAITGAVAVAAILVGVGFSLAVGGLRAQAPPDASASSTGVAISADPSAAAAPRPSPRVTATVSPSPSDTASPSASPSPTPTTAPTTRPTPTPAPVARCDAIAERSDGRLTVNGELVVDPYNSQHGEQTPIVVLRLAAAASADADPQGDVEVCVEVDLPAVVVTGTVRACGEVLIERLPPFATPAPDYVGPTYPPEYAAPTIAGVEFTDRVLDVTSYSMLDVADVLDVPACLDVNAERNRVSVTTSMTACAPIQRTSEDELTISVDDLSWTLLTDEVADDAGLLRSDRPVEALLDMVYGADKDTHGGHMSVDLRGPCEL